MSETLIREIDKINDVFNLERLKVTTNIPCICRVCSKSNDPNFYNFRNVKADLQKADSKFHSFVCEKSREPVDYHELLKTISHEALKEIKEIQKKNKIGLYGIEEEITFKGPESVKTAKELIKRDDEKNKRNHFKRT